MKTCLLTGASGFVGRALGERLGRDFRVTGVSFRQRGPGWTAVDIRDPAAFRRLLRETNPDVVVHAAAYPEPDYCEERPDEARLLNVETVRTLRDASPAGRQLVFISTDYVFDGDHPPYREADERKPISAYGRMKAEAEDLLAGRENTLIMRVGVQVGIGPSGDRAGFIVQLAEAVRSGKEQLVDDVLVRFPTWTHDTAEAAAFLLASGASGIFHMSGERGATRYQWTRETARILGLKADHIKPSSVVVPRKAARPVNSQLATDKIRKLGYNRFTDFGAVVRHTLGLI